MTDYSAHFYIRINMGLFYIRDYKRLFCIREYIGLFYIRDYMGFSTSEFTQDCAISESTLDDSK